MSMSPQTELEQVAEELKKDEPKVVVVVGSGVSQSATTDAPSWSELLKHGVEYSVETGIYPDQRGKELKADLDDVFDSGEPDLDRALDHASAIQRQLEVLDQNELENWLEDAFGDLTIEEGSGDTLAAIHNLQRAGALLLTTNYDGLLTTQTGLDPVPWTDRGDFLQVATRQDLGILHIHGYWEDSNSVIFDKESYDSIENDQKAQTTFRSLWLHCHWLYVGCGSGLDDPNFGRLLEWADSWEDEATRGDYVLAISDEARALENRDDKPDFLECIAYDDHSDVPGILNSLIPAKHLEHFVHVKNFRHFRSPSSYGAVPSLAVDEEVYR